MRSVLRCSAWLCLSLMLWTVAAESRHYHPSQIDAASCSVCIAAHSAAPPRASDAGQPFFAAIDRLQEKDVIAKLRLDAFELVIRGPPAA